MVRQLGGRVGRQVAASAPSLDATNSLDEVGSRSIRVRIQGPRHDFDISRGALRPHPMGGGAVPRIPVVKALAMRRATRSKRTLHETGDGPAILAAAKLWSIRDGENRMDQALMDNAFFNPVMPPPNCLRAVTRLSICSRISAVRKALLSRRVGSKRARPWWNTAPTHSAFASVERPAEYDTAGK